MQRLNIQLNYLSLILLSHHIKHIAFEQYQNLTRTRKAVKVS